MSWLQSLQSVVIPMFAPEPAPALPERKDAKAPKSKLKPSAPRVSAGAGVSASRSGKKSVSGNVKVRSGPSTSSATVKVDEKGRLSGRLGQAFEIKLGGHTLVLGGSLGTDGEVKSRVTFRSAPVR